MLPSNVVVISFNSEIRILNITRVYIDRDFLPAVFLSVH